jgi:polyketide cyclase/dehydrase/lipid transport protein
MASRTVTASRHVVLEPARAFALWTDPTRWATFWEGFGHVVERDDSWPAEGAKLVWTSTPGGRGRVSERVLTRGDALISTRIAEESLAGMQTAQFDPDPDGDGSLATLTLEYELNPTSIWRRGPLGKLTDTFFIRRALADSLARTLRRFATEAAEEASL